MTKCYIKPKWIEIKAKWIPFSCGGGNVLDHIIVTVAVQKILTAPKLQLLVSKTGLNFWMYMGGSFHW